MKRIKIVQPGWEGFTGPLGFVEFKDGVSVDPVPQRYADQVAAAVMCETVVEEGDEGLIERVGPAQRLIDAPLISAEINEGLQRQSERERQVEETLLALRNSKQAKIEILTKEQLEAIVDVDGLPGLRKVGDRWGVRDRAIPALIGKILTAQEEFQEKAKAAEIAAQKAADVERQVESTEQESPIAILPDAKTQPDENVEADQVEIEKTDG